MLVGEVHRGIVCVVRLKDQEREQSHKNSREKKSCKEGLTLVREGDQLK